MELVLNLVWLAIATIAVADFARRSAPDGKRLLLALGALGCALLLLLPAVSISDDLHVHPFFAEDSTATKRLANASSHANPVPHSTWFGFWLLTALFAGLLRRSRFHPEQPVLSYLSPDSSNFRRGRAPPAFLLN